jgi:Ca-activated chloride channel family protein
VTFLFPLGLWLTLVVPILVALYIWAQRRRQKYALRYASLSLVKEAMGRGPGVRRHIPPALFLAAMFFMTAALARPVMVVTAPAQEGIVILAIDVSGSMQADDLKPTRMEAAKAAAKAFVARQGQDVAVGVVSFSGDASLVQSPTTDKDLVMRAIDRLRPQRATAIGRGILTSLDAIFENEEGPLPSVEALARLEANGGQSRPARSGRRRAQRARDDHPVVRRPEQSVSRAAADHRRGDPPWRPRVYGGRWQRGGHDPPSARPPDPNAS